MKKIVRQMVKAEIGFVAPCPNGGGTVLPPEEIEAYMTDPAGWWAKRWGVSRKQVVAEQKAFKRGPDAHAAFVREQRGGR